MISFQKISKRFGRVEVLKGLSMEVARGDRIALVGSNGAGKTTLIRCLLGEYHCHGKVEVEGLDPRTHRTEVLRRIGFVPQIAPPLKMPCAQLIRFAAGVSSSDPERMHEISRRLGLDPARLRRQPFNRLSGGQKQKLLISIALGRDCDILVLDEPAANLDPEARHTFFQLLAERQKSAAMLISSHRLDEVAALVNRVVELDQGEIVLDDHVEDAVAMDAVLSSRITLAHPSSAFAETIREWGFESGKGETVWTGRVSGPDRLRFLGVLSRYAALLKGVELLENGADKQ